MRHILFLLALSFKVAYGQEASKGFVLTGYIKDAKADSLRKATLINTISGKQETVDVINRQFVFRGQVDYPCLALVAVDNLNPGIGIWLSNDTIQATFKLTHQNTGEFLLQTDQVKGSQDALDYVNHFKTFLPLYLKKQNQQISDAIREYAQNHRQSYYSVHLINTYINQIGSSTAKELMAGLSPEVRSGKEAVYLVDRIKNVENNTLGKPINDLALLDRHNQVKKLSTLLKPYTLIHVWASWCKPCREHNPELIALNRSLDPSKVQLIGISVDKQKRAWLNAIQKDNMTWVQLIDPNDFQGKVAKEFAINGIPFTLLVDQNRKVLATTFEDALQIIKGK